MKTKRLFAIAATVLLLSVSACAPARYASAPNAALQQPACDPARGALAGAEKLFEQLDYEGMIRLLGPYENGLAGNESVRLKQLLGAAHYLLGNQEEAARVFRACPVRSNLSPAEFSPSLRAFYDSHAGKE